MADDKGFETIRAAAEAGAHANTSRITLGVADDGSHIRVWHHEVPSGKLTYFFDFTPDQALMFARELVADAARCRAVAAAIDSQPMRKPPKGKIV